MIPSQDAITAINNRRGTAIAVSTTIALREWSEVSQRRELDLDLSDCMDKASSVGLGIALAQPHRKVLVLDCDSVLRANLGSLVTVANSAPENLVHFLFEDGSYVATGGEPIPGLGRVDFAALARDGGYPNTYRFDNLEEFVISLDEVFETTGPTFVSLKVTHQGELPSYPSRTMCESMMELMEALER